MPSPQNRFEILLVEDNPGDVRLIREAAKQCRIPAQITTAKDGFEAMNRLNAARNTPDICNPDLILLDLNLPGKNGLDVLQEIKSSPLLRRIPVVVLTSSESSTDVDMAYEHRANCYIAKPSSLPKYIAVICSIHEFWLHLVKLSKG